MIKLNIDIDTDLIVSDTEKRDRDVSESLHNIASLLPDHKSTNFTSTLWGVFKQKIWEQQFHKCAFCEKEIISSDDAQLEHFRPKTETCDEHNELITRYAYWWLAYEHKNYIVSCATCNNLKGNRFPIEDEITRVNATDMDSIVELTDGGNLGEEKPLLINPRFQDPGPYFAYNYRPDTKMVFIESKDSNDIGEKTIKILDLNRLRKNKEVIKDYLPHKRGSVLSEFKKELDKFKLLKTRLERHRDVLSERPGDSSVRELVVGIESEAEKKRSTITDRFLSNRAPFSAMCLFWLKYDTDLEDDFIRDAA